MVNSFYLCIFLYFPGVNPLNKDSFLFAYINIIQIIFKMESNNNRTPELMVVYTETVEIACL